MASGVVLPGEAEIAVEVAPTPGTSDVNAFVKSSSADIESAGPSTSTGGKCLKRFF